MNKRKKKEDCVILEIDTKDSLDLNVLTSTVEYFINKPFSLGDSFYKKDEKKISKTNTDQQNLHTTGHSFDLLKQANEKYNTLRNTVLLEILEKYKKNDDTNFLSYEYLFKSIFNSYKLLEEYDTKTYDPSIPKAVYLDNKIRVHNMVMKLICGSKQLDHNPSSMVVPLSDNLANIMDYYYNSGMFNDKIIQTDVVYQKKVESITYDEIDQVAKEIEEEIDKTEIDKRIAKIANDSRYLLFLKKTSPSFLKYCESTEEYIIRQEEIIKDKGEINKAIVKGKRVCKTKGLKVLDEISPIEDVKWSKRDLKKFNGCVIKYKNNFKEIHNELPHISMKDLIKKYYLSKDKTFSYIKKKPGRISDTEIKKIVDREWNQQEINIFVEKYKVYGKHLTRYQTWINKTERDLKIFLRYFLKQQKTLKHEAPRKTSISKEDLLTNWSIDERQIFAIYFPYFNKNWITMATYFPKKTSADLKLYYSKYFKSLSYNEQKFEASLSNLKVLFRTSPVVHIGDEGHEDIVLQSTGLIFKK